MPVSNFGFAVAAHPHDGNTAWFAPAEADQRRVPVGAAISVTRTKTFTVLRNGLPQQHCFDLVHRHGSGRRLPCFAVRFESLFLRIETFHLLHT